MFCLPFVFDLRFIGYLFDDCVGLRVVVVVVGFRLLVRLLFDLLVSVLVCFYLGWVLGFVTLGVCILGCCDACMFRFNFGYFVVDC